MSQLGFKLNFICSKTLSFNVDDLNRKSSLYKEIKNIKDIDELAIKLAFSIGNDSNCLEYGYIIINNNIISLDKISYIECFDKSKA